MMKLATIILTFSLVGSAYGIGCRYQYKSANTIKATCKMNVEGKTYRSEGIGQSSMINMARSQACMSCRTSLPQKMSKKLQKKYRNADGSFTIGLKGLELPSKNKKVSNKGLAISENLEPKQKVGQQRTMSLECSPIKGYLFCSDSNFYQPVEATKNSKLQQIMKRIMSGNRNIIKKIPGGQDEDFGEPGSIKR